MKKEKTQVDLLNIVVFVGLSAVSACGSTSKDTKVVEEKTASYNEVSNSEPSTTPLADETSGRVAVRMPEAEWLNKDEPRRKIWEYMPTGGDSSRTGPVIRQTEYRIRQIEISASSLFLYIDHKLTRPTDELIRRQGHTESPAIKMSVDGCPAASPRFAGLVEYNGPALNLIVIPRVDLPNGDVKLRVSAFGDKSDIVLLNYEGGLKVRTSKKQSRWYRNEAEAFEYPSRPGCPTGTIEENSDDEI